MAVTNWRCIFNTSHLESCSCPKFKSSRASIWPHKESKRIHKLDLPQDGKGICLLARGQYTLRQGLLPIGPAPRIATFLPGPTSALLQACTANTNNKDEMFDFVCKSQILVYERVAFIGVHGRLPDHVISYRAVGSIMFD